MNKILYVEDDLIKNLGLLLDVFSDVLKDEQKKETEKLKYDNSGFGITSKDLKEIINTNESKIYIVDNFKDALFEVKNNHKKYLMFVVDRNLFNNDYSLSDIQKIDENYSEELFKKYKEQEGDYLLETLINNNAGNLTERFYFLSANPFETKKLKNMENHIDLKRITAENFIHKTKVTKLKEVLKEILRNNKNFQTIAEIVNKKVENIFITDIEIKKIRHLTDLKFELSKETKKHFIITGKNGSGKTSILKELNMILLNRKKDNNVFINFNESNDLTALREDFKIYFFTATRDISLNLEKPEGVEKVELNKLKISTKKLNKIFLKYLVHLKTQQMFANYEGNSKKHDLLSSWFFAFEETLKDIFETKDLKLLYKSENYDFEIEEKPGKVFGFNTLSDGYSAVIDIITEIMLFMSEDNKYNYDFTSNGIVIIDEIETHLHIELQKKILPFLINMFPNLQFIVSTHSPFVLSSIENSVVYDLENQITIEDMSSYSYDGIVENYFDSDKYSEIIKDKIAKYEVLLEKEFANKETLSEKQKKEKENYKNYFKVINPKLGIELSLKLNELKLKYGKENV